MKLYTYYRSQASFRVRIALNLKGIAREDNFLHLEKGDQFAAAYRVINPQMVVPTLIDGDIKLFQSLAILEYLDEAYPEPPLLPADPQARAWVRGLALINVADSHPLIVPRVRHYLTDVLKVSDDQRLAWIQHWLGAGLQAMGDAARRTFLERPVLPWREPHGRGHLPRHPSDAGHDVQPLAGPLSACHARL
jgi:maleylacetoacetate isomerase